MAKLSGIWQQSTLKIALTVKNAFFKKKVGRERVNSGKTDYLSMNKDMSKICNMTILKNKESHSRFFQKQATH